MRIVRRVGHAVACVHTGCESGSEPASTRRSARLGGYERIVRNSRRLQHHTIVQCQNPQCGKSYATIIDDGEINFTWLKFELEYKSCEKSTSFAANDLDLPYDRSTSVTAASSSTQLVPKARAFLEAD